MELTQNWPSDTQFEFLLHQKTKIFNSSFRVHGAKFDEGERCLADEDKFNYVTVQSSKPIGELEHIEMRITANRPVQIELGEVVARSILCRESKVYTFVQSDMDSMKAVHPGTWDNCKNASLVQGRDCYLIKY